MTDVKVVVESTEDALDLWWLQKATSDNDGHPALQGIHVLNGAAEAADGIRIHRVEGKPVCLDGIKVGEVVRFDERVYKSAGREYLPTVESLNFPDADAIFQNVWDTEPQGVITVNAQFLEQAAQMPTENDTVTLYIRGRNKPLEGVGDTGNRALIMPIIRDRPYKDETDQANLDARAADRSAEMLKWIKEHHPDVYCEAYEQCS